MIEDYKFLPQTIINKINKNILPFESVMFYSFSSLFFSSFDNLEFKNIATEGYIIILVNRKSKSLFIRLYELLTVKLEFEVEVYNNIEDSKGYIVISNYFHSISFPFGILGFMFKNQSHSQVFRSQILNYSLIFNLVDGNNKINQSVKSYADEMFLPEIESIEFVKKVKRKENEEDESLVDDDFDNEEAEFSFCEVNFSEDTKKFEWNMRENEFKARIGNVDAFKAKIEKASLYLKSRKQEMSYMKKKKEYIKYINYDYKKRFYELNKRNYNIMKEEEFDGEFCYFNINKNNPKDNKEMIKHYSIIYSRVKEYNQVVKRQKDDDFKPGIAEINKIIVSNEVNNRNSLSSTRENINRNVNYLNNDYSFSSQSSNRSI